MGLLFGDTHWLILEEIDETMVKKIVCKHSTHLCVFLADSKIIFLLMSTTGNFRYFTVKGTL